MVRASYRTHGTVHATPESPLKGNLGEVGLTG